MRTNVIEAPSAPRVADVMVEWLADRGVRRVFGIPGGAISPLYDALVGAPLDTVVCQHETMAVYLASGAARATGLPGIVAVTSGPGLTNTLTGVAAAYLDEVPLIVLAGEVRTDWDGRGAIQDGGEQGLDVGQMFRSVVRHSEVLRNAEDVGAALERAWVAALRHPRGPVLLRIPVDVGGRAATCPAEVRSPPRQEPNAADIERAAALLASAERPLLLVGNAAKAAGIGDAIATLAARGRIAVATDLEGKGLVPESAPTSLGVLGFGGWPSVDRYLAGGVDVMAIIGSRLDDCTTRGFTLRPTKALIQIDHDPSRLHRLAKADVAILGDLGLTVGMLCDALPRPGVHDLLRRDLALRDARTALDRQPVPPLQRGERFDPHAVVVHLQQHVHSDAVFVSDIGNHQLFAARRLAIDLPDAFRVSGGLGGMGSGIGTAMGLGMAYGGARQVVAICGDGGLLMVGTELATCARYGIPVLVAVFDDGQLGMVEHGMSRVFGRSGFGGVPTVDLVGMARAFGVPAYSFDSETDLGEVSERSLAGPVLLRIPIDPAVTASNPREAGFDQNEARPGVAVAS